MSKLIKGETYGYTNIDNHVFMDYRLSAKAKGVLCQMLSLPDYWEFSIAGLSKLFSDGVDSIRTAINELESNGYLIRSRERKEGKYAGTNYVIYANPQNNNMLEKPMLENPTQGNPTQGNATQYTTKESTTKELTTKVIHIRNLIPPTLEMVDDYIRENGYNVDGVAFIDYYESKGWLVGKTKMKDWQAAVRNWNRNEYGKAKTNNNPFAEMLREGNY